MDYQRVLETLLKKKWIILLSVFTGIVLTWGTSKLAGGSWNAKVRFMLQRSSPLTNPSNVTDGKPDWGFETQDAKALETLYSSILVSKEVLNPTLDDLKKPVRSSDITDQIQFRAIGQRMFELQVNEKNSRNAEVLANTLAKHFMKQSHRIYTQKSADLVNMLQEQLTTEKQQLGQVRKRFDAYTNRYHLAGTPSDEIRSILLRVEMMSTRRNNTQEMLIDRQSQLRVKEAELAAMNSNPNVPATTVTQTQLDRLQAEVDTADRELKSLRKDYFDANPKVMAAKEAVNEAKRKLNAASREFLGAADTASKSSQLNALTKNVSDLRSQVNGLQAALTKLDGNITREEAKVSRVKFLEGDFNKLYSDLRAQETSVDNVNFRLKHAQLAKDTAEQQNPITIIESVNTFNPPLNAAAGRTKKLMIFAAASMLLLSCGLLLVLDSMDRRVKNVQEADLYLPTKVIAAIPQPTGPVTYASLARAAELQPQSLHSESYRFLALRLLNEPIGSLRSVMAVTAKAEQGSTSTITNLGITLAQAGKRVILVDANMRSAEMHQVFGLSNDFGFTDVLQMPTAERLSRALNPTSIPNLLVITSGSQVANPWELFRSSTLGEVTRHLEDIADFVLYDTPSAVMFTDALNLVPVVDAAVLCVRAQEMTTGAEKRLVDLLEQAGVKVLGSVLNDVPTSVVEGYDNYRNYYAPILERGRREKYDEYPLPDTSDAIIEVPNNRRPPRNGKHPNDGNDPIIYS